MAQDKPGSSSTLKGLNNGNSNNKVYKKMDTCSTINA